MRIGRSTVKATITLEDGTVLATPDDDRPFDRIQFERKFDRSWPPVEEDEKDLDEDGDPKVKIDLSDDLFLFMAWVQLNRQGLASGALKASDFDAWLVNVVDAEWEFVVPEAAAPGADVAPPTDPAASATA